MVCDNEHLHYFVILSGHTLHSVSGLLAQGTVLSYFYYSCIITEETAYSDQLLIQYGSKKLGIESFLYK